MLVVWDTGKTMGLGLGTYVEKSGEVVGWSLVEGQICGLAAVVPLSLEGKVMQEKGRSRITEGIKSYGFVWRRVNESSEEEKDDEE